MRWFSAAFHDGSMSDRAQDEAIRDYGRHVNDLGRIAPDLNVLADLNLHGAQVRRWALTDVEFRWSLLVGDLERGYQIAVVTYLAPSLIGITPSMLEAAKLDTGDGPCGRGDAHGL